MQIANHYSLASNTYYINVSEWYWKCMVYPWGMWILSFAVILLSIIVVWSECLFFIIDPVLSIFALLVQVAADDENYLAIEVCTNTLCDFILLTAYFPMCSMF